MSIAGAHVIAAGRDQEQLDSSYGTEYSIDTETVDLLDEKSIADLIKRVEAVDHVVSTASARARGVIANLDRDAIRLSFETKGDRSPYAGQTLRPRYGRTGVVRPESSTRARGTPWASKARRSTSPKLAGTTPCSPHRHHRRHR
jgi:hypothetical protein